LREVLPIPATLSGKGDRVVKRHKRAIYILVFAGVIFRSELAIVLATQVLYLLIQPATTLQRIIPTGIRSFLIALAISVPIDSYLWRRPLWPELAGFVYNALYGNASDWGTSPYYAYFISHLPKLLLNPLMLPCILFALNTPAIAKGAAGLVIPSLAFIAIYSFQPHKEARFIIYVVPPLVAAAALGASYIFTRRAKSLMYFVLTVTLMGSVAASFVASCLFLGISSLNYPGGEALWELHQVVERDTAVKNVGMVRVHMDVLSCMTGVSLFQQEHPTAPFSDYISNLLPSSSSKTTETDEEHKQVIWEYSKEENKTVLLNPEFWEQFDYVLTESPETVIGKWDVVSTIYGYAGIELLRPGVLSGPDHGSAEEVAEEIGLADQNLAHISSKYEATRDVIRRYSRGWWLGPRMEAKIKILKKTL
jgi:alpha-1,6-mannosyltransferase